MSIQYRYFKNSPKIIRLAIVLYVKYPLSLRHVEDLLFERGIDICDETIRLWWNRSGPALAAKIRKKRIFYPKNYSTWRWHLDEVFVKIRGEFHYLCVPLNMKVRFWKQSLRKSGIRKLP